MKRLILALAALYSACSFGATLTPIQLLNPAGSTSGQAIVSTGASSAPAWGNVNASTLAAQAANTVLANVTASSASPTAFSMPSCSSSTSALQYTSGTGFTCGGSGFAALSGFTTTGAVTVGGNFSVAYPTNSATLTTYSDTAGEVVMEAVNSTTPSTKYFLNLDKYGGGVKVGGTLTVSGLITPTYPAGIKGNISGSNVTAGSIGEVISSNVLNASAVSFPNQTATNVTSITLTPGDWDIWGQFITKPTSVTSIALITAWLSTTSATMPTDSDPTKPWFFMSTTFTAAQGTAVQTGVGRINVSSNTTLYLSGSVTFSGGTMAAYGNIQARRR